jgi:Family of unknown function (DUF6062)
MVAAGLYLDEALRHRGCPLCYLGAIDVLRYLWYLLYECVTSPTTHDKLESSWGFCNVHAWLVQEMNWRLNQDGMSTANLCEWQIDRFREILAKHLDRYRRHSPAPCRFGRRAPKPWLAQAILTDLTPAAECPACVVRRDGERAAISALVEFLRDRQDIRAQYQQSFGLCLSHFKAFLERVAAEDDVLEFVIGVQIERLTALSSELGEYLRKHDYRFSHEAYGEERDAFIRATEVLAGAKPCAALLSQTPPQPSMPGPQATEGANGVGCSGPGEPT